MQTHMSYILLNPIDASELMPAPLMKHSLKLGAWGHACGQNILVN